MHIRTYAVAAAVLIAVLVDTSRGHAQNWSLGGNVGLSSLGGSAGFHLTPMAELFINRNMGVGSEFSVNTQYGVPLLWHAYFKYYFSVSGSRVRPYVNAGPVVTLNVAGAPYFGVLFGGGVNIPLATKLYVAPDILLGPVFGVGGRTYPLVLYGNYYGAGAYGLTGYTAAGETVFTFTVRAGLRYEI